MQKNILNEKKKLILFLSVLILFSVILTGCNWFENGIINIFDPQAQIRIDYQLNGLTSEGTADIGFDIISLNEAEFIGEKFLFEYYVEGSKITELTRIIGATFYLPPKGNVSLNFPLYFQDVIDYMTLNPQIVELDATITVMGTDSTGKAISKLVTFDLPAILPGIDFTPPEAYFDLMPSTTGVAPFTVVLDASGSTDDRGIASYSWDFGDNTSGTGITNTHTYQNAGIYSIILTVTDYWGNEDFATETVTVEEAEECEGDDAG